MENIKNLQKLVEYCRRAPDGQDTFRKRRSKRGDVPLKAAMPTQEQAPGRSLAHGSGTDRRPWSAERAVLSSSEAGVSVSGTGCTD